ncbi:MAG: hypothetical protein HY822_24080 [Acidobacteria bacterium]|nr:hypothetical protein [Acidobacteriota bacterium]
MLTRRDFGSLLAVAANGAAAPAAPHQAGYAERDITPDIGMEQPGGYGKVFHKALHDPCKVRAAVFDDGARRVALAGVDALMVPRALVLAARAEIRQRCGLPPEAVLIGASHSHSSGPTGMVQPGEYDHASPLVRKLAYEQSSAANPGYLERVRSRIVEAICAAHDGRTTARTSFGVGVEDKAAFNRRFRMRNGLTYTHPGKGNPDIVKVAGPIDPAVTVLGTWNDLGQLTGCVVHYACHATTSPPGISANWIYYLERAIRGFFGPGAVVVFLQGFSGDVTQVNNLDPHANPNGDQWARLVGGRVGAEAVRVLLSSTPGAAIPLDAKSDTLRIPRRAPSPERVRQCLEIVQRDPKTAGATNWTFAKEILMLDALLAREKEVEAEIQGLQVGPAVFLSAPGEMFCQLGLDIRAGSRFPFPCPVELANGCVGYVPTEEALGPHGGGYETRLTAYSNLAPDAGPRMVRAAVNLARQMKPGALPEAPPAPPFREPWSYGNVPPELS